MKIIEYPNKNSWMELCQRPNKDIIELDELVNEIFTQIKLKGDKAVMHYTLKFDKVMLNEVLVAQHEINNAEKLLSNELKEAILVAQTNIKKFHLSQIEKKSIIETSEGVFCWRENRPIEKIGIYIPGGTAPLFSTVLMLGIPAQLAGCKEIVLCSPPNSDGALHPAILYAAQLVGVTLIFKVGGIQAISALTFGTETIPSVYKIFGPGNQYVTAAKQKAQNCGIAIDMPAGPSEVLIIADKTANPEFIAADLLAQAEHGADSQVILLSDNQEIINKSIFHIKIQIQNLPRKDIIKQSIQNSKAIFLKSIENCFNFSNIYAPEHLILALENPKKYIPNIINASSVFLGHYSCESAGDYASGTNHTLPTNGYSKNYSGVSIDSFVKKISFQEITKEGILSLGSSIEIMAEAEDLFAHKNAIGVRLKTI